MANSLTPKQRQQLKAKAHALKPVIIVGGKGLTEALHKEIDRALYDHELIKISLHVDDRDARAALVDEICRINQAERVQVLGKIGVIYRESDKDR